MCLGGGSLPPAPPPPPPPPRFLDRAITLAREDARLRGGGGGFRGTISGTAQGVLDPVNLIKNQLLATQTPLPQAT